MDFYLLQRSIRTTDLKTELLFALFTFPAHPHQRPKGTTKYADTLHKVGLYKHPLKISIQRKGRYISTLCKLACPFLRGFSRRLVF